MAEQAAATVDPDERLVRVGPLARLLMRPDFGAFVGAVAVWFAFAYFARAYGFKARTGRDLPGRQLLTDSLGEPGTPEATYIGLVRHNVEALVSRSRR